MSGTSVYVEGSWPVESCLIGFAVLPEIYLLSSLKGPNMGL